MRIACALALAPSSSATASAAAEPCMGLLAASASPAAAEDAPGSDAASEGAPEISPGSAPDAPGALETPSPPGSSSPPSSPDTRSDAGSASRPSASPYRTEVVVGRERGDGLAAQRNLSRRSFGFVTAIDLASEPGRPAADDLASVVSRAPGVTVRSIGGLGQFSAVSLRGSTSLQVPIFLDGAPLSGSLSGVVDLGAVPLDALARIELHRGHAPARYGAAAIGGVMDLVGEVHRGDDRLWLAGGFGSFLAREARAGYAHALRPDLSIAARIGYAGARGDFSYYDDANTPLIPEDDGYSRRLNNDYDRLFAQLRVDHRRDHLRVSSQLLGWWKTQGIPGTAAAPAADARGRTASLRNVTRVRRDGLGPGGYVEWIASLAVEDRLFRDLGGEVGLAANDQRALSFEGWISPRLRAPLWRGAWLELSAEARGERVTIDERYGDESGSGSGSGSGDGSGDAQVLASGDATRGRTSLGLGVELEQWLFSRRWAISPALRVDLAASNFAVPEGQGEVDDAGRDSVVLGWSPRLASKLKLVEGLEARASVGRYLRFATLFELFGDRGYLVGNEGLRPEQGTKVDGGLILDLEDLGGAVDLFAQVVGFATWSEDLIQWVRSGPVIRPTNVAGARVRGLEAGLSLRAWDRDLSLDLAYTLLDSRNESPEAEQYGQPLPGRPRHSLLARPAGGHRFRLGRAGVGFEPRVFWELEWIAGNTLDLSGRVELPPRLLHGAGLSLRVADRVELGVQVRNLGNLRQTTITPALGPTQSYPAGISDFIGFPLPGRSVWGSLRVDLDLPRKQ
ncbi:TonB-dependent receptor [Pseudenhygromyxa sp. WMMC2535]|uniref:TonB-dependent receptor plug domain-containing protein n=1 Tax=Pseudenhygromyxa sp. WMMC2535 TaxID=2712867 RepID=UPI001551C549|nr:TonB-dependent receptor [Pseudenhygromyxa sp. WMMC2535]NVB37573.1 TonB-dependent receptor [Pseudenhygromyxa sp. WMMC2535]